MAERYIPRVSRCRLRGPGFESRWAEKFLFGRYGEFRANKERPLPLGHEFSGVVHQVGKAAIFKVGQKVVVDPNSSCLLCDYCRKGNYQHCLTAGINSTIGIWRDGGWAQYCRVPQDQVYALPDGITTEQAGLCEPYSCVSHGFDRASPLLVGDKILIVGAGIIGNLWVTALHHQGHRDVTVSEMNKSRLEIVKKMGQKLYAHRIPSKSGQIINPFEIYVKELTIIGVKINPYSFPKAIGWLKAMGSRYVDYEKLGVKTYSLSEYQNAMDDLKAGSLSMKTTYFVPIAVETMGPWIPSACSLFKELSKRFTEVTGDQKAKNLGQLVSLAIQRGNAASLFGHHSRWRRWG
ncbi:hypothetical protein evm_009079 [Chilo suppressalis]|nr:hypothetical protein evm_009079 [Chilo suppressalis]